MSVLLLFGTCTLYSCKMKCLGPKPVGKHGWCMWYDTEYKNWYPGAGEALHLSYYAYTPSVQEYIIQQTYLLVVFNTLIFQATKIL